jgi:hypothetical protein
VLKLVTFNRLLQSGSVVIEHELFKLDWERGVVECDGLASTVANRAQVGLD